MKPEPQEVAREQAEALDTEEGVYFCCDDQDCYQVIPGFCEFLAERGIPIEIYRYEGRYPGNYYRVPDMRARATTP